jgi:Hypothetical methyltransferase
MEKLFSKKPAQINSQKGTKLGTKFIQKHPNQKPEHSHKPKENTPKDQPHSQNLTKRAPETNTNHLKTEKSTSNSTPHTKQAPAHDKKKQAKSSMDSIKESLESSRFRLLNEMLYTQDSKESQTYFADRHNDMATYHDGFRNQTARWPVSPVGVVLEYLTEEAEFFKGQ